MRGITPVFFCVFSNFLGLGGGGGGGERDMIPHRFHTKVWSGT